MKRLAKFFVAHTLVVLCHLIIRKYRPAVVMVTGSVGKTSTKDAVAAALSGRFNVRASEKSYNSEFGVPLTVIGAKNPWTNPWKWLQVFQDALALILLPSHYPKTLVLEVGADSPGDIARILRIATPDVVVVTKLPEVPVHVEAYASPQAVREEEFAPAYALAPGAPLIVSSDDSYARSMAAPLPVRLITYGYSEDADVRIGEPTLSTKKGEPCGMEAVATYEGKEHVLSAPGALGRQQLYAPAAALGAALALGVSHTDAQRGLKRYTPPPGRARILMGIKGSILIDDSYNASPAAVEEALGGLSMVPGKRRIAVLGDMLELGRYSQEEHARIGSLAAGLCNLVIGVGKRARAIADAARLELSELQVFSYDESDAAAAALEDLVEEGDIILIKGSQSIRMERIVKKLLRNPEDRGNLVRQDREWQVR